MSRYFNGKEVELLAPIGNYEILTHLLDSKADAFYLGGKYLNMRMHRKDFNFDNDELKSAINLIHSKNKKVYITLNNLITEDELEFALTYLKFLESIKPDAIIVQDMSILKLIYENNIDLEIHSSVMMNVHNSFMIDSLKKYGVTRVVASREMDLKTLSILKAKTDMEFEYFAHGDMCIAHGSQCHYSKFIFNMSSNRGRCMKPCRWKFDIEFANKIYSTKFPLAVKDMCMYENIPELINSGVTSFKIEGRMRTHDYLLELINIYSDSIDRYISDPFNFLRNLDFDYLYDNRKRDFSTAFAFGNLGLENINERYEGTGKFYSSGKVFSTPIEEFTKNEERIVEIKNSIYNSLEAKAFHKHKKLQLAKTKKVSSLSVKINSYEQLLVCCQEEVETIYINFNGFIPNNNIKLSDLKILKLKYPNSKFFISLPKMSCEHDHNIIEHIAKNSFDILDGFLVANLGQLELLRNYNYILYGDYTFNIYNSSSAMFYKDFGLNRFTHSIESELKNIIGVNSNIDFESELIVHGQPTVMYLEHNIFENIDNNIYLDELEKNKIENKNLFLNLIDDLNQKHPILIDNKKRNHMLSSKELSYIDIIDEIIKIGISNVRIEGSNYTPSEIKILIQAYKYALDKIEFKTFESSYDIIRKNDNYTLGALQF